MHVARGVVKNYIVKHGELKPGPSIVSYLYSSVAVVI